MQSSILVIIIIRQRNITAPLPCIAKLHAMMNMIKYLFLVAAPVWGSQQMFGTVTGNPVDNHIRRHMLNTADEDIRVFFQCQNMERLLQIISIKIGSFENMEQLELDTLYGLMSDIIGGSQHVISSFTGKPENHMGDNFDASFVKIEDSCIIDRQWIASPDVSSGLI